MTRKQTLYCIWTWTHKFGATSKGKRGTSSELHSSCYVLTVTVDKLRMIQMKQTPNSSSKRNTA